MQVIENSKFTNVFYIDKDICTPNLRPGISVYGERLVVINDIEYRFWNPWRSKLAALILKGCKFLPIEKNSNILYLGAGNGTTASHISDMVIGGKVYCIEFAPRAFRDLLKLARDRRNIFPILENAFYPEKYKTLVGSVDIVYQDLSQREQPQVFINNSRHFLKQGGYGVFMVKAKSIDMAEDPEKIYSAVIGELKMAGFKIIDEINLSPYSKDHLALVVQAR